MTPSAPVTTEAKRRLGRSLMLPVVLIFVISGLVMGVLLYVASREQDNTAIAASEHLTRSVLGSLEGDMGRLAKDYSWWDDAVTNLVIDFDRKWAGDNVGWYLNSNHGVSATLVLAGADRAIYAALGGEDVSSFDLARFQGGLAELLMKARASAGKEEPAAATGILLHDGIVHLVAASIIAPYELVESPDPRAVLVLAKALDTAAIEKLGADYGLPDLRLVRPDGPRLAAAVPLKSSDGMVLGVLTWNPPLPSQSVLTRTLPLLGVAMLVMAVLLSLFIFRAQSTARQIEERTVALDRMNRQLQREVGEREQAEEALRQAHGELERRVEDRTVELRAVNAALRAREAQFRQAHLITKLGYWFWDQKRDRLTISPEMAEILKIPQKDVDGIDHGTYLERFVHPEDRLRIAALTNLPGEKGARFDVEYRLVTEDEAGRWVREVGEVVLDISGDVIGEAGTLQDITEHKAAEEQLRQLQKMEAVGQLTGGVAHDFNNLLSIILGNAEILSERLGDDDRIVRGVMGAATRGAELTQRLLAFSRRQQLHPQAIDLNGLIEGMMDLMRRSLGEAVEIKSVATPGLGRAMADPGQLENAFLNLAINARDAMPGSGTLVIETDNVTLDESYAAAHPDVSPGDYVMLAVTDTGSGMVPEVLEHAFEPFFTTKDVGEGSGLGLSMVYGFAKQTGGHVTLYSEPGHGTAVKLYLPRTERKAGLTGQSVPDDGPKAQGETILVVEDDADVRRLAVTLLKGLDYQVLEAPDGKSALAVMGKNPQVDLLLSDVVLSGGMNGPELARAAKGSRPDLRLLYMSGYAENAMRLNGTLSEDAELLNKPFRKRDLARMVRAALDRRSSA